MGLQVLAGPPSPPAGWLLSLGETRAHEVAGPEWVSGGWVGGGGLRGGRWPLWGPQSHRKQDSECDQGSPDNVEMETGVVAYWFGALVAQSSLCNLKRCVLDQITPLNLSGFL